MPPSFRAPRVLWDREVPAQVDAIREAVDDAILVTPDGERCPACQATIRGAFCMVCGEEGRSRRPQTIPAFLQSGFASIIEADSRLLRSVYALIRHPGRLTNAFLNGHRKHYIGPLKLFALVNLLFVLVANTVGPNTFRTPLGYHVSASSFLHEDIARRWVWDRIGAPADWLPGEENITAPSAERGATEANTPDYDARFQDYGKKFNRTAARLSETLVFLFIPGIAVFLWLTTLWKRIGDTATFLRHLVHATHMMTVVLLMIMSVFVPMVILYGIFSLFTDPNNVFNHEEMIANIWMIPLTIAYITASSQRVDGLSWIPSVLRSIAFLATFLFLLLVYRAILFFTVFTTMAEW